jgi:hypothetical protein
MSWSYDGDPTGDRKDEVRFMVGDTDATEELVSDEEITFVLGQYPPDTDKPAWLASAHVADSIAAKFARRADRSIGPLSLSAKQQRDHYVELAASLRALHATNGHTTSGMGGIRPAAPRLGGGGTTYLGGTTYINRDGTPR